MAGKSSNTESLRGAAGSVAELKAKVATACRILGREGITLSAYGHVSARVPNSDDEFLIKSRGPHEEGLEFATADDVVMMDPTGNQIGSETPKIYPPNEKHIHLAVYRHRPEINSVIHAHPDVIVALTASDRPLLPLYTSYDPPGMLMAVEGIPIFNRSVLIYSMDLGDELIGVMGNSNVCLMRGHGVAIAGETVEDAVMTAIALHELAKVNWMAYSVGTPVPVDNADIEFYAERRRTAGPINRMRDDGSRNDWHYYQRRLELK